MIKRLITLFSLVACFNICAYANQEHSVNLVKGVQEAQTVDLDYANITFKLVNVIGNDATVSISVDAKSPEYAILIFKNIMDEKALNKMKPKINLDKYFPGNKGEKFVTGCPYVEGGSNHYVSLIPNDNEHVITIRTSVLSEKSQMVPFYLAKYNPKKAANGKYDISYTVLEEHPEVFKINVKAWSEHDPEYVKIKESIHEFIQSMDTIKFCSNKKHIPSLSKRQEPYQQRKDSLRSVITGQLQNPYWMEDDEPYKAYNALLGQLQGVDLNKNNYDCGNHIVKKGPKHTEGHSCGYCSMSAGDIYNSLDDLYQKLHTGKISKDVAVKKAKALYSCYQSSTKRKKEGLYKDKIPAFYNRIVK